MDLFSKEYQEHIKRMRSRFFATGSSESVHGVRPEILACWKTAYLNGVIPGESKERYVSYATDEEYSAALAESSELLNVAEPYMQLLHSFLDENSFWVALVDRNGVIIRIVASPQMRAVARSTGVEERSYRNDMSPYPGLYYTCRQMDKPFRIVSGEHASQVDDILAGAASPIHEIDTGELLGVIGISGYCQKSHDHTMGLTILAAEAISQQLALRKRNLFTEETNRILNEALEAVNAGTVYFQKDGYISAANHNAVKMLCGAYTDKNDFIRGNIFEYLSGELAAPAGADKVKEVLATTNSFTCELIPAQKYEPVYCTIRQACSHPAGYFLQMQPSSERNKIITEVAFSQAVFSFSDIIGNAELLLSAKTTAQIAAEHNPAVLITGESGTGKEMFAQAIHNSSSRAGGPFVAINCGAIPKPLIESELFGYEAGAFTGAQKGGHVGKFELANGGTIFLDEVGDMPYELQIALLRVLQTKEVTRIGGKNAVKIDVRIIAATNQDLEKRIQEHTFRQDLYYRLNILNIRLPSLRERLEDIRPLCEYFIKKYGRAFDKRVTGISESTLNIMMQYNWPGNVRELENTVERAILICKGNVLEPQDLPENLFNGNQVSQREWTGGYHQGCFREDNDMEQTAEVDELLAALRKYRGNVSEAARQLGVSRPTVYRKMKKYGINPTKTW